MNVDVGSLDDTGQVDDEGGCVSSKLRDDIEKMLSTNGWWC